MKRFFENFRNNKNVHYILIFLAATIAAIPLIKLCIYGTDDGFIHILRIMGVENILKSGKVGGTRDSGKYSQFKVTRKSKK